MSKKLMILAQILALLSVAGTARAENVTYNVYENGRHVGTMTIPGQRYPQVVERMRGTGVTFQRPVNADRRAAAEARMDEWRRQDEARRAAALEKQRQWEKQYEERHAAAERRVDEWKRQDEARRAAAQEKQRQWQKQ